MPTLPDVNRANQFLERSVNRDCHSRMPPVVEVISSANALVNVNIVRFIPVRPPCSRPWINQIEPKTTVLEARVTFDNHHRHAVNAEPVLPPKMRAEPVIWNAIAAITAPITPVVMFMLPVLSAVTVPNVPLFGALSAIAPVRITVFGPTGLIVMHLWL